MATRFHLEGGNGNDHNSPVAPALAAPWSGQLATSHRRKSLQKINRMPTAFVNRGIAYNYGSGGALLGMTYTYVSDPLAAQTIDGTVKGQVLAMQDVAAADLQVHCTIRLVNSAGTHKAYLYNPTENSLVKEVATGTLTNMPVPYQGSVSLTSQSVADGDRLLVEIGFKCFSATVPATYTGTFRLGGLQTGTDLPENETDTDQTKRPWIEFSDDIVFLGYWGTDLEFMQDYDPSYNYSKSYEFKTGGVQTDQINSVTDIKRTGATAEEHKVRSGDNTGTNQQRAEWRWMESNEEMLEGEVRFYGWSDYFQAPWFAPSSWGIFKQWHAGQTEFNQSTLKFDSTTGAAKIMELVLNTGREVSGGGTWEHDKRHTYMQTLPISMWVDCIVEVLYKRDFTGYIKIKLRTPGGGWQTVAFIENIPTLVYMDIGGVDTLGTMYMKGQFYRNDETFTNTLVEDIVCRGTTEVSVRSNFPTNNGLHGDDPDKNAGYITSVDPTTELAGATAYTDSFTVRANLTPTITGLLQSVDTVNAAVALTPSVTGLLQSVDTVNATLALTPSVSDIKAKEYTDTINGQLSLTPVVTGLLESVEAPVGVLVLTPSLSEAATRVDTTTNMLVLTPSFTENAQRVDSITEALALTASITENAQFVDAVTDVLVLTPSMGEVYTPGGGAFTDSYTLGLLLSPTVTGNLQSVDSVSANLKFTPTLNEQAQYVESFIDILALTPSISGLLISTDTTTGKVTFTPQITEVYLPSSGTDSFTSSLKLTFSLVYEELFPYDTLLTAVLSKRFSASMTQKYSAVISQNWSMRMEDVRFTASLIGRHFAGMLSRHLSSVLKRG